MALLPEWDDKIENYLANGSKGSIHYATATVLFACGVKFVVGPQIFHGYGFILYYPAVLVVAIFFRWSGPRKNGPSDSIEAHGQ